MLYWTLKVLNRILNLGLGARFEALQDRAIIECHVLLKLPIIKKSPRDYSFDVVRQEGGSNSSTAVQVDAEE
jgi:hypothetical protein